MMWRWVGLGWNGGWFTLMMMTKEDHACNRDDQAANRLAFCTYSVTGAGFTKSSGILTSAEPGTDRFSVNRSLAPVDSTVHGSQQGSEIEHSAAGNGSQEVVA